MRQPGDRVIVRPERQPEFEAVVVSIEEVRERFRPDAQQSSTSTWVRALSGHYSQWHTFKLEYIPKSTLVVRVGYLHDDEPLDTDDTIAVLDYLAENHERLRVSNE